MMVGRKSSGEKRPDQENPVHNHGYNLYDTFFVPPQRFAGRFPDREENEDEDQEEPVPDGGVMIDSSPVYGSHEFYDVENPVDQFWWDEVAGGNSIPEVYEVFEEAGIEPVYGRESDFIHPTRSFDGDEIEKIFEAVDQVHGGTVEQFVDEVMISDVHPQHSKQIERYFVNENYVPESFSRYDGFPVESKPMTDGGGPGYSDKSSKEVTGYSVDEIMGM